MKIKTKEHVLPIYDQKVAFVVGEDFRKYILKKYNMNPDSISEDCAGQAIEIYHVEKKDRRFLICMRTFDWTEADLSILTHECSHATYQILSHLGIKHTDESDEAYAYLHGYIFGVALKWLNPNRKKKSKKKRKKKK